MSSLFCSQFLPPSNSTCLIISQTYSISHQHRSSKTSASRSAISKAGDKGNFSITTATPVDATPLLTRKLTALAMHSRNEPYSGIKAMALVIRTVDTHLVDQSEQKQMAELNQQLEELEKSSETTARTIGFRRLNTTSRS